MFSGDTHLDQLHEKHTLKSPMSKWEGSLLQHKSKSERFELMKKIVWSSWWKSGRLLLQWLRRKAHLLKFTDSFTVVQKLQGKLKLQCCGRVAFPWFLLGEKKKTTALHLRRFSNNFHFQFDLSLGPMLCVDRQVVSSPTSLWKLCNYVNLALYFGLSHQPGQFFVLSFFLLCKPDWAIDHCLMLEKCDSIVGVSHFLTFPNISFCLWYSKVAFINSPMMLKWQSVGLVGFLPNCTGSANKNFGVNSQWRDFFFFIT